jgi:hypothetical protein
MTRPQWAPAGIDIDQPSVARIYDYNLGGSHNFASDRAAAEQLNRAMPGLPAANRANRSFLRRAVQALTEAGITQFLDLGSGIPTAGNVHDVARRHAPDARVVYVDIDPVAVAHGEAILAGDAGSVVLRGDLREADRLLADPSVTDLLDFDQPIAVLMVAVLHFVPDEADPAGLIGYYRDATVPGSYLVVSHGTAEGDAGQDARATVRTAADNRIAITLRGRDEVAGLFRRYELVPPGIVYTPQWRPEAGAPDAFDADPSRSATLAAVGVRS